MTVKATTVRKAICMECGVEFLYNSLAFVGKPDYCEECAEDSLHYYEARNTSERN